MSPKPMEPAVGDHVAAPAPAPAEEEIASNEFTPQELAAAEQLLCLSESVGSCSSGGFKQSSDDDSKSKTKASSEESWAYSSDESSESKSSSGSGSESCSASSDDAPAPVVLIGAGRRPYRQKTRSLAEIYAQTKPIA